MADEIADFDIDPLAHGKLDGNTGSDDCFKTAPSAAWPGSALTVRERSALMTRQRQQAVTGKRDADDRQQNLFGIPAEAPPLPTTETPKQRPDPKPSGGRARPKPPPLDDVEPEPDRLPGQLARLSAPELRGLVETLPDEALANLVLATIRQLKRRLVKSSRNGQKGRASALDRAAQQLVVELGGQSYEDDY